MQSSSIRTIRRAELSRAAFEAVIRYGLRKTTLDKVGDIAGVSKGVVLHHFKDKSALLEAVFRRSNSLLSESVVELYRYAETPYERLWAIIVSNFFETIFNRPVCQAWVSLISEVPHNEECQRVQISNNQRIRSNLMHELKHFFRDGICNLKTAAF
jgi:TetR/AcrR family transcriptional repressor of bet genes